MAKKHYTGKLVLKREVKPVNILQKNLETINKLKPYAKKVKEEKHEAD